ncbi:MAG: hypothetical protein ABIA93_06515 [Candidatus Woesearchaeota archaeon]
MQIDPAFEAKDTLFLFFLLVVIGLLFLAPSIVNIVGRAGALPGESYVQRTAPVSVNPGADFDVTLQVEMPNAEHFYLIEEVIPSGFMVIHANSGNAIDDPGHIKWLALDENNALPNITLSYTLRAPITPGDYILNGSFQFETSPETRDSSSTITVEEPLPDCSNVDYVMDYDDSGTIDISDIMSFNNYYTSVSTNLLADVDGDGVVTYGDWLCFDPYARGLAGYPFPPTSADCSLNCAPYTPVCGDTHLDTQVPFGEQCDDGNLVDWDDCSSTCQIESCTLFNASITPSCGAIGCNAGDTLAVEGSVSPQCNNGNLSVLASNLADTCSFNIISAEFPPFVIPCNSTSCSGTTVIPQVPIVCRGEVILAGPAQFFDGTNAATIAAQGVFAFVPILDISGAAVRSIVPPYMNEGTQRVVTILVNTSDKPSIIRETVPAGFTILSAPNGTIIGQNINWSLPNSANTILAYTVNAPAVSDDIEFTFNGTVERELGLSNITGAKILTVVDTYVAPNTGGGSGGGGGGGGAFPPANLSTDGLREKTFEFGGLVDSVFVRYSGYETLELGLRQFSYTPTNGMEMFSAFSLVPNRAGIVSSRITFEIDDSWLETHEDVSLYYLRGDTPIRVSTTRRASIGGATTFISTYSTVGNFAVLGNKIVPPIEEQPGSIDNQGDDLGGVPDEPVVEQSPILSYVLVGIFILALLVVGGYLVVHRPKHETASARLVELRRDYASIFTYVKQARTKGAPEDYIKARLLGTGWREEDVDLVLKNA